MQKSELTLEQVVESAHKLGLCLSHSGAMIATAESCTGGLIAMALTEVAGSSAWYERGFVTYTNQAKIDQLGVASEVLNTYGAVSEPVARAMSEGALKHSVALLSLSVTGIAGPTGGSAEKPVGTVCFSWSIRPSMAADLSLVVTRSERLLITGDRKTVRLVTALHALEQAQLFWQQRLLA